VVHGRSCLALAIARELRGMFCAGTTCLLIDAAIVIGCVLLTVLFVPLPASLNALLSALYGDAE
jgi:hypothetical protein